MTYWQRLQHTVSETIRSGQIGTAVFVRASAILGRSDSAEAAALSVALATLGALVSAWFAAQPRSLYAVAPGRGHATLSIEYQSGSTALLSVGSTGQEVQLDLMVLGSLGAIYHRETIWPARDGSLDFVALDPGLVASIEGALAGGTPVVLDAEGGPA